MSKTKKRRKLTPRQELGIQLALKLGLPQVCPLLEVGNNSEYCVITKEPYERHSSLCELDLETGMDYRICPTFSEWFWREAQKMELELAPTPVTSSSKSTSNEGKEGEEK